VEAWCTRSPGKLEVRRRFAAERGLLRPKPGNKAFVCTDVSVAPRLRQVARGLEATRSLERQSGLHRRSTAGLAEVAASVVGRDDLDRFRSVSKVANTAKHKSWLDKSSLGTSVVADAGALGAPSQEVAFFEKLAPVSAARL